MEFEFDPTKSEANKAKHGIDFVDAQLLWYDNFRLDVAASHSIEQRRVTVGRIGAVVWTGVYTMRAEIVRIISVRRARTDERFRYEEHYRSRIR